MTRTSFINKLIPLALTYGGLSYLGLLWYSDYLEKQKKVLKKRFINVGHGQVNLNQIKMQSTPQWRLNMFLKECARRVERIKTEHHRPDRIIRSERTANSITLMNTSKPTKHQVIKSGRDIKQLSEQSDYETIFGLKVNHRTKLKVIPQIRLEYARQYWNGLLKVKQKVDLASSCWKLNLDSDLLIKCIDKAEDFEEQLKLQIYKHHVE